MNVFYYDDDSSKNYYFVKWFFDDWRLVKGEKWYNFLKSHEYFRDVLDGWYVEILNLLWLRQTCLCFQRWVLRHAGSSCRSLKTSIGVHTGSKMKYLSAKCPHVSEMSAICPAVVHEINWVSLSRRTFGGQVRTVADIPGSWVSL